MRDRDPIVVVEYDASWPQRFRELAGPIRDALGDVALRIDHIGSTAIPGLAAKPVIDMQISVASLAPDDPFRRPLEALGYVFHPENRERTKRFFREPPGAERTHVHVRRSGSFDEQLALLFRDYVRAHVDVALRYAELKHELAVRFRDDRDRYVEAKQPFIWEIIAAADEWAQLTGWEPGASDA